MPSRSGIILRPSQSTCSSLLLLGIGLSLHGQASSAPSPTLVVNGYQVLWLAAGAPKMTADGQVMLPAQAILDLAQAETPSDNDIKSVTSTNGDSCFALRIETVRATLCNSRRKATIQSLSGLRTVQLKVPPMHFNDSKSPYIGVADLSQLFGYNVNWNATTKTLNLKDARLLRGAKTTFERFMIAKTPETGFFVRRYNQALTLDSTSGLWVWKASLEVAQRDAPVKARAAIVLMAGFEDGGIMLSAPQAAQTPPVPGSVVPPDPCTAATSQQTSIRCTYRNGQIGNKNDLRFVILKFVTGF
jgi:Copper amine oxidase N-terminal domain